MKRTKIALALSGIVLLLGSCDKTPDVAGTWEGNAVRMDAAADNKTAAPSATTARPINTQIATNLTFIPDATDAKKGTVELASDIDVVDYVPFNDTADSPYELNIAATSVATGSYHFTDDDEIVIAIDNKSVKVNIDPEAVSYGSNVLTGVQTPAIDSIKPAIVNRYNTLLLPEVKNYYSRFNKIDDIKVKESIMSCEIGDRDYTFRLVK